MGRVVTELAAKRDDCQVIAGVDLSTDANIGFPIFAAAAEFTGKADVIIDFSHPSALEPLLRYAVGSQTPAVIATTGLGQDQLDLIHTASDRIPVFF